MFRMPEEADEHAESYGDDEWTMACEGTNGHILHCCQRRNPFEYVQLHAAGGDNADDAPSTEARKREKGEVDRKRSDHGWLLADDVCLSSLI